MSVVLLTLAVFAPAETLMVRTVDRLPAPSAAATLGAPAVRFAGGRATVWLVRVGDTVAVYAAIRDSSASPHDELVVSLDMAGDGGAVPGHDDFQWRLRRTLDSSVVLRGRGGRWEAPRADPDWRLGPARSGGGWEVEAAETDDGWALALRLHPAMLAGESGRPSTIAFRMYGGGPGGWHAWPERQGAHPTEVERAPFLWAPVRSQP